MCKYISRVSIQQPLVSPQFGNSNTYWISGFIIKKFLCFKHNHLPTDVKHFLTHAIEPNMP